MKLQEHLASSEESEGCSNQESELACIHGVQNRYQDELQVNDMQLQEHLASSEESEGCSNQESELACIHGVQNRYQDELQVS